MQATPENVGAASTRAPQNSASTDVAKPTRRKTGERWLFSLTAVCFLFGGLLALQMRAIQSAERTRLADVKGAAALQAQQQRDRIKAEREQSKLRGELASLKDQVKVGKTVSQKTQNDLSKQLKNLSMISGLSPVSGPGVRIEMHDNPAVNGNSQDRSGLLPGLIHDFDLLQVVNELRAANAEAISVNGIRITAYTPIRCVGPVIQVNWQPAAAPFVIEAIGDPSVLDSALTMSQGIIDNLRSPQGPGLPIKIARLEKLTLPAASGGAPNLKAAHPEEPAVEKDAKKTG